MQSLQICIGPTIRIGRKSWCLPYVGFFLSNFTNNYSIFQQFWVQITNTVFI